MCDPMVNEAVHLDAAAGKYKGNEGWPAAPNFRVLLTVCLAGFAAKIATQLVGT